MGGKAGAIVFVSLALIPAAAGGGGYLWVSHFRQTDGSSESSGRKGGAAGKEKEIDQKDWLEEQERQLQRAGLHELVEQAKLIRQDIDSLQKDIDAYEQRFEDLRAPDTAKRLIKNERAVRYVVDRHGDVLPSKTVARTLRAKLDELTFSAGQALSKPNEAFAVSEEVRQAIDLLRFEVDHARGEYIRHRLLVETLIEGATEEQDGDPGIRENTTPMTSDRSVLDKLLERPSRKKQDADPPGHEKAVEDNGGATEARTPTKE